MKNILLNWLFGDDDKNRIHAKDIKRGDHVWIEHSRILTGIGWMTCLNNDPVTRMILLEVTWNNTKETEKFILPYSSKAFKNYHLLNQKFPVDKVIEKEEQCFDIASLQKQLNKALKKEEYEKADELQKQIDKLVKK